MLSGTKEEPEPSLRRVPDANPDVRGDFVSDDLRSDTARFLNELHRRMRLRAEHRDPRRETG